MSMTRSAFLDKLNSIEARLSLLERELTEVRSSLSQEERGDFEESKNELMSQSVLLVEEFFEGKDSDFLLSDAELSNALYSTKLKGSDSMDERLIEFKSSIPYVNSETPFHIHDIEKNLAVNIFFLAIPHDADPMKLDELAEKLDKVFRVQREIMSDSEQEAYISLNFVTGSGISYQEDREKPYFITGSEGEYGTLRQALDVVREVEPYKPEQNHRIVNGRSVEVWRVGRA